MSITKSSCTDKFEIVCHELCGNILLSDQVQSLEIWKEKIEKSATVTISVFNNAVSNASIQIVIYTKTSECVDFTVPPGNTLSATVEDAKSIMVYRLGEGTVFGKYCIDACFPVFCRSHHTPKRKCGGCSCQMCVGDRKSLFC
ncbi:MAG: S-Ena type endospore appendage [Anaerobacillus sp.]